MVNKKKPSVVRSPSSIRGNFAWAVFRPLSSTLLLLLALWAVQVMSSALVRAVADEQFGKQNFLRAERLHGMAAPEARRRADAWIERLGIGGFAGRLVGGLSAGMRQRVMIGRAMVHDPPLLVLDEATTGLDPVAAAAVCEMIAAAGRDGRTVLFSSHVPAEVEALAGRVSVLSAGRVVFDDTPARLAERAGGFAAGLVRLLAGKEAG